MTKKGIKFLHPPLNCCNQIKDIAKTSVNRVIKKSKLAKTKIRHVYCLIKKNANF